MKKHIFSEAKGEHSTRLQSVFGFSALRKISLLVCFCLVAMPWRVAGQCPNIEIDDTEIVTWDYPVSVDEFWIVKDGGQLIITDAAVVTFYQSCAGIRVESGGYLSISNNARLTSDGSGTYLWMGIEAAAHNTNPVGSFTNCTIEHAQVGISLGSAHMNNAYFGACAIMNNVTFLNNQLSLKLSGPIDLWQCGGGGPITNCTFSINTSVFASVVNPVRFIEMSGGWGHVITGTTFSDVTTTRDVQGINDQGAGTLEVTNCTFNGVDKGIFMQASTNYDRILNNTFTNMPAISYCTFPCSYSWGTNYGLFTVGSNRYRAEGNSFTGTSRLTNSKLYGIVTDNSSTAGALMFKNTFTNTTTAFQSQNNNINYAVSCNTFTNYVYGGSLGSAWYTFNGSLRTQGNNSCTNSNQRAGNEWTSACNTTNAVDIRVNSASYFHYYGHYLDQAGGDKTRPECSTPAWEPTYVVAHYCPNPTDAGYQKTATACNTPFYTCPGCRLTGNDLDIEPQLLNALNYYRKIADSVSAESESIGSRNALEQTEHYVGLAQLVSNEIAAQLLAKSVDTAILYLESSDLLEDKKALAEMYLSAGRFEDCHKVVDNVINSTGWTKIESVNETVQAEYATENSEFTELFNLLLSIYESGRRLDKCTEEEVASLEQLSKSATLIGPKACAYLKAATGKECSYSILSDDEEEVKEKLAGSEQNSAIQISAYPNPANDRLIISVLVPENSENPELSVYDITGRKQEQLLLKQSLNEIELNTSAYTEGVYLLQVKTANSVKTLRFSVQK